MTIEVVWKVLALTLVAYAGCFSIWHMASGAWVAWRERRKRD